MAKFVFDLLLAFLTVFRFVFPFFETVNIGYNVLPVSFEIESVSHVYSPEDVNAQTVCEYPSVIRLCHQKNSEDNGKLLATFEKWADTYPVYISTDDALTWQYVSTVRDNLNEGFWNEWMPFLYELPADMGEFEKGTIILAATSIYGEGVTDSTITLYYSTDLGATFTAFCNVDKAGGTEWGVWEPYFIYEEETGRIFCFYSDDSDPEHSQKLVYKYTTDLVNWSEKKECVACADPALRPGMVSVTKLGNGEYYMVYEMVGIDGNPIYCMRTTDLDNWGDVADYGEKISAAGKVVGSSPCVAWSPAGGECGTLIMVGKHHVSGNSKTGTDMFISFDYGKTFAPIDNPIPYSLDYERCGYSPSLFFSPDGTTLYYANNQPCHSSTYSITVAKISITEK